MNYTIATVVIIACTLAASAGAASYYDYNSTDQDRGLAHWFALTEIANNTCGGDRQSPIDIETRLPETSGCDLYKDYIFMVSSVTFQTCGLRDNRRHSTILLICSLSHK